jgi:hypothetical protein
VGEGVGVVRKPRVRPCSRSRWGAAALAAALLLPVSACDGGPLEDLEDSAADVGSDVGEQVKDIAGGGDDEESYAVEKPGPFDPPLQRSDVLISASDTLPENLVEKIRGIEGVRAATQFSMASLSIDGRTLTVAGVDPAEFRSFTPVETAQAQFVWDRLAGGEVAVDPSVPKKLVGKGDMIKLGTRENSPSVHVGAYAPLAQRTAGLGTVPVAQVAVNEKRAEQLGLPERNALLVSTTVTPSEIKKQLKGALPPKTTLQILALEFRNASQTAVLAGTSVSDAIGKFTYTNGPDGTIKPDQRWVNDYIRTEEVPILGQVTCNKAYLPQLRGALNEVVQQGLASEINPEEYAGCYYPRYIGRSPENGLSLHSWGIAVDINVPGNLQGTRGEIDRRVVAIMKKWGMAWGGDWSYTDPMHFEMDRVVRPG